MLPSTHLMKETTDQMTLVLNAIQGQIETGAEIIIIIISLHTQPSMVIHHVGKAKTTLKKNTHRPKHAPKSTTKEVIKHRPQHNPKTAPIRLDPTAHTRPVVSFTAQHPKIYIVILKHIMDGI